VGVCRVSFEDSRARGKAGLALLRAFFASFLLPIIASVFLLPFFPSGMGLIWGLGFSALRRWRRS
ncbi:MAG: hypothetical protein IKS66_07295, partial [Oscillospiraceae bacterium]|nr:hypothetical protein [Oscillospiraceae bacterium]